MRMLRTIGCVVFCLFGLLARAQEKGFMPVKNLEMFKASLTKANSTIQTISSDFTQTKNLSLLSDKIRSKGKFYFKKEDKVRIEYTTPYSYVLVMNAGQLMVKDEQKTNKINTKNSKAMQSVNRIIIDCMRGTVFQNPDFNVGAFEDGRSFLLSLVPANESMKKMFKQIDVYMDKKTMEVHRLSTIENGGDNTDMDFTNTRHNINLDETVFKIK